MKTLKRITAGFLCLLMILSAGCAAAEEHPQEAAVQGAAEIAPAAEAEEEDTTDAYGRELIPSAVPADLRFDGETFTVLSRYDANIFDIQNEFLAESRNGEPINDAVFTRNSEVEDQLGVKLAVEFCAYPEYDTKARTSYKAGDAAYDIYSFYAYYGVALALEGIFANLLTQPVLDLSKPWWNQNFIDEMTLKDQLYFIAGDLSLSGLECTHAVFFNKQLLASYLNGVDLYGAVDEGTWTADYFSSLVNGVYTDTDGDGTRDEDDLYGVVMHAVSIPIDSFLDAFDLAVTTRGEDGLPKLTYMNERTISAYEKLYALCHENSGSYFGQQTLEFYWFAQDKFRDGQSVFLLDIFQATDKLREMTDDYGVLPLFKYDEAQSDYYTNVADVYSLMALSSVTQDREALGAVFELLGQKSYDYVIPAYFEVALKQKYARDNIDAKMYDRVLAGCRYNFGFVYSVQIGSVIHLWRTLLNSKSKDFVSSFKSQEKVLNKQLNKLIDKYDSIETGD